MFSLRNSLKIFIKEVPALFLRKKGIRSKDYYTPTEQKKRNIFLKNRTFRKSTRHHILFTHLRFSKSIKMEYDAVLINLEEN